MGSYHGTITIPANTPINSPVILQETIEENVMTAWEVYFPAGCAGLCYVAVEIDGTRIIPESGSADPGIHGEGSIIWSGRRVIGQGKLTYTVKIIGWNLDDTYDHHPIIRITTE